MENDAIKERFYLPIGILAATFAGSVFFELVMFETISIMYNISEGDTVYEWWAFILNLSFLFGFLPAFLNKLLGKNSFILGGLLVTAAHVLALVMIVYEGNKKSIMQNSSTMAILIAVLGGQGASLLLISLLQNVMSAMSVLSSHFVAGMFMSYFFGSVVFFMCLAKGMLGNIAIWFIIIVGAVMYIVAQRVLPDSDSEDDGGLMGAAAFMTKGILNKRTAGGHLFIQFILSVLLVLVYIYEWQTSTGVAVVLLVLWALNLAVPIILAATMDEDAIKELVGAPEPNEQYLMMNKAKEGEQGTLDFWLFSIVVAFSVGFAFTTQEQAGPLALRNSKDSLNMIELQGVCAVVGSTFAGIVLLYQRENISPAAMFQLATFFSLLAAIHVHFLEGRKDNYAIEEGIFVCNGLALGINFVCMATFCFEEYGKTGFTYTFGIMMTFCSIGFVIADLVIFQWTFDSYAGRQKEDGWHRLYFGNWSESVAFTWIIIEVILFIVGIFAHRTWSSRQDSGAGAVADAALDAVKNLDAPNIAL